MLHQLRSRLIKANVTDIQFTAISAATPDPASLNELRRAAKSIPVIQRAAVSESWSSILEDQQNNILVVDKCGRLTYQIIMPWSILHYPYVKASILSTYNDNPCGPCEEQPEISENSLSNEDDVSSSNLDNLPSLSNISNVISKISSIVDSYHVSVNSSKELENVTSPSADHDNMELKNITKELNSNSTIAQDDGEANQAKSIIDNGKVEYVEDKHSKHQGANKKDGTVQTIHKKKKSKDGKKMKIEGADTVEVTTTNTTEKDSVDDLTVDVNQLKTNVSSENPDINLNSIDDSSYDPSVTLVPLKELKNGGLPLRVIMRSPHKHNGVDAEYLEFQLGNPGYHGHLDKHSNRDEAKRQMELDEGFETRPESPSEATIEDARRSEDTLDEQRTRKDTMKDMDIHVEDEKLLENITTLKEKKVVDDDFLLILVDGQGEGNSTGTHTLMEDIVLTNSSQGDFHPGKQEREKKIKVKVEHFVSEVLGRKELYLENVLFSDEDTKSDGIVWSDKGIEETAATNEMDSLEDNKDIPWDDTDYTITSPVVVDYWPQEADKKKEGKVTKKEHHKGKLSKAKSKTEKAMKSKGTGDKDYTIVDGDEMVESDYVEKKQMKIIPRKYDSSSVSSEESTNDRVRQHYSKILPWVNFKI